MSAPQEWYERAWLYSVDRWIAASDRYEAIPRWRLLARRKARRFMRFWDQVSSA